MIKSFHKHSLAELDPVLEEAVREWLKKGPDFEQYQKKRVVEILSN